MHATPTATAAPLSPGEPPPRTPPDLGAGESADWSHPWAPRPRRSPTFCRSRVAQMAPSTLMIDAFAKEHLHSDLREVRTTMLWKLEGLAEYDIRRPLTSTGTNPQMGHPAARARNRLLGGPSGEDRAGREQHRSAGLKALVREWSASRAPRRHDGHAISCPPRSVTAPSEEAEHRADCGRCSRSVLRVLEGHQARSRKKAVMSSASMSGSSWAAKWPPRGMVV